MNSRRFLSKYAAPFPQVGATNNDHRNRPAVRLLE
jgi:hypothetical protein